MLVPLGGVAGLAILVLGPSPLLGPRLAAFVGATADRVGALASATLLVSLPLVQVGQPAYAATLSGPLLALVVGLTFAAALPTVRDAMLPALDGARYVALALIFVVLATTAAPSVTGPAVAIAAGAFAVGVLAAAAAALFLRADPLAAAIGGGLRDPAVAGALVIGAGLSGREGAIPLAYAGIAGLALLAVRLGKLFVRREAIREAPDEKGRR